MAVKKAIENQKELWLIEKIEGGIHMKTGKLGYAKNFKLEVDSQGDEHEVFVSDFTQAKFPNSNEDLCPEFDLESGKWAFDGDDILLQSLVKKINLRYPEKHIDKGKYIEKASITDRYDPFFDNPYWREDNRFQMKAGKLLVDTSKDEWDFILRCHRGRRRVQNEDTVHIAAGSKFRIKRADADSKDKINKANLEMELNNALYNLTIEQAKLIALIMGLTNSIDSWDTEAVKPNLLEIVKRTDKNPDNNIRLFAGGSYQSFFMSLKDDDLKVLGIKANIKRAMNSNLLRYRDGEYELKGKKLGAPNFEKLYQYFIAPEGNEDYNILVESL